MKGVGHESIVMKNCAGDINGLARAVFEQRRADSSAAEAVSEWQDYVTVVDSAWA